MDSSVHRARRAQLTAHAADNAIIVAAGGLRARNYAGNPYPFRASSHFLFLIGHPLPGAVARLEGDRCEVFVEPPAPDDALWHGETPDLEALARRLGCSVRPKDELAGVMRGRAHASLPVQDPLAGAELAALLGHAPGAGPADPELADAMIAARLSHDDHAQRGLRVAAEATAAAHLAGMAATRPGLREHAVLGAMEAEIRGRGMTTAYSSIVTVHGEVLHNHAHHHELREGDLLLADVGAESPDGWAGDVTRTWPVSGRFSPTQRQLYDVVLRAQRDAIAAVRPGARYRDVHLVACRSLTGGLCDLGILRGDVDELVADGVHALLFPHGVGHLLGLDVHDMEDLGDRAGYAPGRSRSEQFGLSYLRLDRDLVPGMAVTIEPGLYRVPAILADPRLSELAGDRLDRTRLEEYSDVRGIRIEDDVLVTEAGHEVLTAAIPKTADDVEAVVRGHGAPTG